MNAEIEWREIPGFPGYQASSEGEIKSYHQYEKILKGNVDQDGYLRCVLFRDGNRYAFGVHQLVALTFIGDRPDGYSIHHKNDNKKDNCPMNLEYIHPSEHSKFHHGNGKSYLRGERHWKNKLTEEQAKEIKRLLSQSDIKQGQIAKMFGVGRTTINEINMGRAWGWLSI